MKLFGFYITKHDWESEHMGLAKRFADLSDTNKQSKETINNLTATNKALFDSYQELSIKNNRLNASLDRLTDVYRFLKSAYAKLKEEHQQEKVQIEILKVKGDKYDTFREKEKNRKNKWRKNKREKNTSL